MLSKNVIFYFYLHYKTPCHFWQGVFICFGLITRILPFEALSAVDRLISTRLERNLCGAATVGAHGVIHLTEAIASAITAITIALVGPAGRATGRLILKTLLCKESLFGASKYEFGATIPAGQGFVGVHG
jgi:hypothetical protein